MTHIPQQSVINRLHQMTNVAQDIHMHLSDIPELKQGLVHFRPVTNGVTMVGLHLDFPQRGKGGYNAQKLHATFNMEFPKHCLNIEQGRSTPEKQLQSFLIGNAYRHDRQMVALQSVLPDADETNLHFVTDEISVVIGDEKVVCDILAINKQSDGIAPVLMELKSARAMKRLIEQIDNYTQVLKTYASQYEGLFSALLGETITFTRPLERWMVWPSLNISQRDPREKELAQQNIRVVGYVEDADGFRFHVGKLP